MPLKPTRSMTGFALFRRDTEAGELTISLRSVNHRGLDLHFHHSHEFAAFENTMRAVLKEKISRGHIEIRSSIARQTAPTSAFNTEVLKQYAQAFEITAAALELNNKPDLNALLSLPGVITQTIESRELDSAFEAHIKAALTECLAVFNECREREGNKLADDMLRELRDIEAATTDMASLRATILPAFQQRLQDKLRELLAGSALPDSRIVEECALLADRSDIQEELTRLTVHSAELRRILATGGPVGKPIDFLLQEMNRETNTISSKSSTAGDAGLKITAHGLAIKANIERIREQALNLE